MEFGTVLQQSTTFVKNKTNALTVRLAGMRTRVFSGFAGTSLFRFLSRALQRHLKLVLALAVGGALLVAGFSSFLESRIDNLRNGVIARGLAVLGKFPESEAANWLARARSERSEWQIESIFKLKAIVGGITEEKGVRYALVKDDKTAEIWAHSTEALVGTAYAAPPGREIFRGEEGVVVMRFPDAGSGREIADFSAPIFYGKGDKQLRMGSLHVGYSYQQVVNATQRKSGILYLFALAVTLVGFGAVAAKDRVESMKRKASASATDRIGNYILERKIASGGMGELYMARKEVGKFRMRVALKRILAERADDSAYITHLLDEANLASQLKHPNIAIMYDYGDVNGTYFIVMEFVDGADLKDIIQACGGSIPLAHAVNIVMQVCRGLEYAHNKTDDFSGKPLDIVHRDISPQNILISCDGAVKIIDFGIARAAQRHSDKTSVGIVKGKLHYLSPEQACASEKVDRRSDIFSLGLIMYELFAGRRAYREPSIQELLHAACKAEITPLSEVKPEIPPELNRIVMKALARDREDRYQSAGEIHGDLAELVRNEPSLTCEQSQIASFMSMRVKGAKGDGGEDVNEEGERA